MNVAQAGCPKATNRLLAVYTRDVFIRTHSCNGSACAHNSAVITYSGDVAVVERSISLPLANS
jgi:hypothetical protein